MKWALSELNKFRGNKLDFSDTIDMASRLAKRDSSILDVAPIHVEGFLQVDDTAYLAHFTMKTVITVPSSRSLTPVEVPLELEIDEEYMTQRQFDSLKEVTDEEKSLIIVLEKDIIDLLEPIEDFILLNLPLQALTEEEKQSTELPKGDFWTVISEDDLMKNRETEMTEKIDPRLAKLSELFNTKDNE